MRLLLSNSSNESATHSPLLSPPRGWPQSFRTDHRLSGFIGSASGLGGRRCRLVGRPPDRLVAQVVAAAIELKPHDSLANAAALEAKLGLARMRGYALYELEMHPGVFAAREHHWNRLEDVWLDLTPRPEAHESIVLVDTEDREQGEPSSRPATSSVYDAQRSVGSDPPVPHEAPSFPARVEASCAVRTASGERWQPSSTPQKASSLSILEAREQWEALVSDLTFRAEVSALRTEPLLHSYLQQLRDASDPKLELIRTNARSFAVLLDDLTSGPVLKAPNSGTRKLISSDSAASGNDGSGVLVVRPPDSIVQTSTKHAKERQAELYASMLGVWTVRKGVKHGRIRLQLRPAVAGSVSNDYTSASLSDSQFAEFCGGEFALEGQSWSSLYETGDVHSSFFADLEEDDESAAQMRCSGRYVLASPACLISRGA